MILGAIPPGYARAPGVQDAPSLAKGQEPGGLCWAGHFWPLTADQRDQLADYGPRCWRGQLSWDEATIAVLLAAGLLLADRQLALF